MHTHLYCMYVGMCAYNLPIRSFHQRDYRWPWVVTRNAWGRVQTFPSVCDVWLFPKLRGCRYGTIEGHWHAHTRGLPWGLPEVVGKVQQVHCSKRRLLRKRLEFHLCTINKSAHMKKSLETYLMILVFVTRQKLYTKAIIFIRTTHLKYSLKIRCSIQFATGW